MADNSPEKRFVRGGCTVSVFVNQVARDGRLFDMRKAVFQKRYMDKEGGWKSTTSLDVNDIPRAMLCLSEAFAYMTEAKEVDEE